MISAEAKLVKNVLTEKRLETPFNETTLSNSEKIEKITTLMADVSKTLGLDLNDDSLQDTPKRIAKMYVNEIFSGLDYQNFPKITVIENKMNVDEMIKVKNISLLSTCEHHFVTIDGLATVAYLPNSKVIGLSKINRLVTFFGKRPQIQERLTRQILVALQTLLETENVAVTIDAVHYCVKSRGIQDTSSSTVTTALGGIFKTNESTRTEFLTS